MYKVWDNMAWRGEDEHYDHEDLKRAYHKGKKEGWREAMEEVGYGERDDYNERGDYEERGDYGERGGYGQRGNYGMRDDDMFGERRGVKGTGRYSRYRRG